MKANSAEYTLVAPGSLEAVLSLIAQDPGKWTPIAGGTELMVQYNAGRLRPKQLVSIYGLRELTTITIADHHIRIGAGVTYTQIRNHAELGELLPLLARAATWTGSIANQNRGTLGGNLVNGSPAADSPPALLVYEASVELISARGTRTIPYADFHTGYKQTQLAPDEIVLAVVIPRQAAHLQQYLRKVGPRNAMAISKIALAAVASLADGTILRTRIALASVSHSPFRCYQTEAFLAGKQLSPELIAEARAVLTAEITPLDDIRSTARYRSQVASNLLAEFLEGCPMISATNGSDYRGDTHSSKPDHPTMIAPSTKSPLQHWESLHGDEAIAQLLTFCRSHAWAVELLSNWTYTGNDEIFLREAESVWFALPEADWLEAFAAHPRIGERKAATTAYLASSETEQSAAQATLDTQIAEALLAGNRAYEEKFGFRYIVFASGRTAGELLTVLEARLQNTRAEELLEAAKQQQRITELRMKKWLETP